MTGVETHAGTFFFTAFFLFFCSSGSLVPSDSFSVEQNPSFLFIMWTGTHAHTHHTPASRPAWSSRTMSNTEENTSFTSVEAGSAALSPPDSGDPVGERESALQPPSRTETTVGGGGGRRVTVTLEKPACGRRKLSA